MLERKKDILRKKKNTKLDQQILRTTHISVKVSLPSLTTPGNILGYKAGDANAAHGSPSSSQERLHKTGDATGF